MSAVISVLGSMLSEKIKPKEISNKVIEKLSDCQTFVRPSLQKFRDSKVYNSSIS